MLSNAITVCSLSNRRFDLFWSSEIRSCSLLSSEPPSVNSYNPWALQAYKEDITWLQEPSGEITCGSLGIGSDENVSGEAAQSWTQLRKDAYLRLRNPLSLSQDRGYRICQQFLIATYRSGAAEFPSKPRPRTTFGEWIGQFFNLRIYQNTWISSYNVVTRFARKGPTVHMLSR